MNRIFEKLKAKNKNECKKRLVDIFLPPDKPTKSQQESTRKFRKNSSFKL